MKASADDANGPDLSDEELAEACDVLSEWQAPEVFQAQVESFARFVRSSSLFNKPNAAFLRDAIPIADFTKFRAVESVRLVKQNEGRNDGKFKTAGKILDIEVTEVLQPGRRRGDEYREGKATLIHLEEFDPNQGENIANELQAAIQRKANKRYVTRPLLLLYLNISTSGRLGNEVETAIIKSKIEYADNFHEVCVLWGKKLY